VQAFLGALSAFRTHIVVLQNPQPHERYNLVRHLSRNQLGKLFRLQCTNSKRRHVFLNIRIVSFDFLSAPWAFSAVCFIVVITATMWAFALSCRIWNRYIWMG
jgi:hypothetical protein